MSAGVRRVTGLVLAAAALYLGLFWSWAGIAKALAPTPAYEFAARVAGGGAPAKAVVVASVVVETMLGLALLVRAVRPRAGVSASLVLLLAFSGLLAVAKSSGGGGLACGCFAFFATTAASVDRELWINGGHAAILVVLLAAAWAADRRPSPAAGTGG